MQKNSRYLFDNHKPIFILHEHNLLFFVKATDASVTMHNNININITTNQAVLSSNACIPKVPKSYLGRDTDYIEQVYSGFPRLFQTNFGLAL